MPLTMLPGMGKSSSFGTNVTEFAVGERAGDLSAGFWGSFFCDLPHGWGDPDREPCLEAGDDARELLREAMKPSFNFWFSGRFQHAV